MMKICIQNKGIIFRINLGRWHCIRLHYPKIVINKYLFSTDSKEKKSWIDSYSPTYFQPYLHLARADKQVGTLLLFWPCCWSVALAAPLGCFPDPYLIFKFGLGSLIMRSAGCIINDMMDKDFDALVERTKNRPIASGAITMPQALGFLALNLTAGLGVLLSFNTTTILLGFSVMPIVIAYPLMKRVTYFPQLVLGMAFNWGAIVGYTAVVGSTSSVAPVIPLYLAGICWTLVYDTIYAYQDREDDKKIGVKSTALFLGDHPQIPLTAISAAMITSLCITGYAASLSTPYYIGIGTVTGGLLWQIWTTDPNNTSNLWLRFNTNRYLGGLIATAIIAGHF